MSSIATPLNSTDYLAKFKSTTILSELSTSWIILHLSELKKSNSPKQPTEDGDCISKLCRVLCLAGQ